MFAVLFAVLVVFGFGFWFAATLPNGNPWAERTARGLWLAAAVIWAWQTVGSR